MTDATTSDGLDVFQISGSDRQRLQTADKSLAFVEQELAELDCDRDDLTYLMEVMRHILHRALAEQETVPVVANVSSPSGQTH
jgi:membrane-bound inhibitor of C-type lysozyme